MTTDVETERKVGSQGDQDLVARRIRRQEDLSAAALQEESPLRANLLAEAASAMATGHLLDRAIKEALGNAPDVLERFEQVAPAADVHLRYVRLSTRLIELYMRLDGNQKKGSKSRRTG